MVLRPVLVMVAPVFLAACNVVPDAAPTPTPTLPPIGVMAVLRAGNPKVCVDTDVEAALGELLRPADMPADRVVISISDASLEGFDQQISRAQCHANLRVDSSSGGTNLLTTPIVFAVAPSADDPDNFVVLTPAQAIRERLGELIAEEDNAAQERDDQDRERQQVASIVTPSWLAGRWVLAGSSDDACTAGPTMDMTADGSMAIGAAEGTYVLTGTTVRYDAGSGPQAFDITTASANGMSMIESGKPAFWRRC